MFETMHQTNNNLTRFIISFCDIEKVSVTELLHIELHQEALGYH